MKFDRVLSILVSLLSRERVTAPELAERFGVSARTIYRDVRSLEEAGIPVVSRQGQGGGLDLVEGYTLHRQLLKPEEIERLGAALKGLLRVLPDAHSASSLAKVAALEAGGSEYFYFDMSPWSPFELAEFGLTRLHEHCRRRQVLSMAYRDNGGRETRREVEPMTLVYRGSSWYLFAWCRQRVDYRLFRLSSIGSLTVTGERFERRGGTYEGAVLAKEAADARLAVRIRFDAEAGSALRGSRRAQTVETLPDGSVVADVWLREDDIMPYCAAWGPHIEVLSPPRVREALIAEARARLARYQT